MCLMTYFFPKCIRTIAPEENPPPPPPPFVELSNNHHKRHKHIFFAIKIDIFKICFKSLVFPKYNAVILRFEIVSDLKLWMKHQVLPPWSCCFFFNLSKYVYVMNFPFTNFFFFLTATNVLATSWLTFSNTRITVCFFYFLILFSHGSLMEINSTHVCFRGWILCFDDEKQKDNNTFKDNS